MSTAPSIRNATVGDIDTIVQIEQSGPIRWGRNSLVNSLDGAETILVAEVDGSVVGFIIGLIVADEATIENIAVEPGLRRLGVARELILAFAEKSREAGAANCYLEVGEHNVAARELYRSLGFSNHGSRPKFYSDNEDAILMRAGIPDLLGIRRST